jgi:hypothetical protein
MNLCIIDPESFAALCEHAGFDSEQLSPEAHALFDALLRKPLKRAIAVAMVSLPLGEGHGETPIRLNESVRKQVRVYEWGGEGQ